MEMTTLEDVVNAVVFRRIPPRASGNSFFAVERTERHCFETWEYVGPTQQTNEERRTYDEPVAVGGTGTLAVFSTVQRARAFLRAQLSAMRETRVCWAVGQDEGGLYPGIFYRGGDVDASEDADAADGEPFAAERAACDAAVAALEAGAPLSENQFDFKWPERWSPRGTGEVTYPSEGGRIGDGFEINNDSERWEWQVVMSVKAIDIPPSIKLGQARACMMGFTALFASLVDEFLGGAAGCILFQATLSCQSIIGYDEIQVTDYLGPTLNLGFFTSAKEARAAVRASMTSSRVYQDFVSNARGRFEEEDTERDLRLFCTLGRAPSEDPHAAAAGALLRQSAVDALLRGELGAERPFKLPWDEEWDALGLGKAFFPYDDDDLDADFESRLEGDPMDQSLYSFKRRRGRSVCIGPAHYAVTRHVVLDAPPAPTAAPAAAAAVAAAE